MKSAPIVLADNSQWPAVPAGRKGLGLTGGRLVLRRPDGSEEEVGGGVVGGGSFLSVKDHGAIGDGVTDDTAAINEAAQTLMITGGTLFFPKGTYLVRKTTSEELPWSGDAYGSPQTGPRPCLQVFSNMVVLGEGMGASVIEFADQADSGSLIHANTSHHIVFQDITLDGNRAFRKMYDSDSEGIDLKDDCRDIYLNRVEIRNVPNEGLDIDNVFDGSNLTTDIVGFRVFVTDCIFNNCGGTGVHNAFFTVIDSCQFIDCGWHRYAKGINGGGGSTGSGGVDGGGENTVIRASSFLNCTSGIDAYRDVGSRGRAKGDFQLTGLPSVGDTITVGLRTYTWRATGTLSVADDIEIRTDAGECSHELAFAINGATEHCVTHSDITATYDVASAASGNPAVVEMRARVDGIDGNSLAISADDSANIAASGATLDNGGLRGAVGMTIENCLFEGWEPNLPAINSPWDGVVVLGCVFRGTGRAITAVGQTKVVDCNITIEDNTSTEVAIAFSGTGSTVSGTTIVGGGILLNGVEMQVTGCNVSCAYTSIKLSGSVADRCQIIGNSLTAEGLDVDGDAANPTIIEGTTSGQVDNLIAYNVLSGGNHGIKITDDSVICGNRIFGQNFTGITISGEGNTVTGNRINSGTTSIVNTGVNNTISGNYGTGIPTELYVSASPEGSVTAVVGSTAKHTGTGAVYRKTSGSGNTGWVTP